LTDVKNGRITREPNKALEKSGGEPVAVLKNSALVGYFVPAEAILQEQHRTASIEEIRHSIKSLKAIIQPVLYYLKDK
jgi:antitoxin StbD